MTVIITKAFFSTLTVLLMAVAIMLIISGLNNRDRYDGRDK